MEKKKRTRSGQWLSSQRRSCLGVRRLRLGLEPLEDRRLLAFTMHWNGPDGFLFVDTDSSGADLVEISAIELSGVKYLQVGYSVGGHTVGDPPDTTTRVHDGTDYVRTEEVFEIEIKTDDGDDEIDVSGITTANGYNGERLHGNIELKGQAGNDTIIGSDFDDILEGRDGNDHMSGGLGDDVYRFDDEFNLGDDRIVELTGEGTDSLDYSDTHRAIDIDLSSTGAYRSVASYHRLWFDYATIENVYASFPSGATTYADTLAGNALDNILQGRNGNDVITGRLGDDYLEGGDGNDTLWGNAGDDHLSGGPGVDNLYGGVGNDVVQGDGFGDRVETGELLDPTESVELNEASGLVVSRANTDVLWTIEDHGNETYLFANDTDGETRGYYNVTNGGISATNVDWEDLAYYDDGTGYLYIADIGDASGTRNFENYPLTIYRVEEPTIVGTPAGTSLAFEAIHLEYDSGVRNAETFMIDPLTGDFYIVSKSEPSDTMAHLYKVEKPAEEDWSDNPATAETLTLDDEGATAFRANTPNNSPSGGDISPDGREVVLKSDDVIHLYNYDRHSATRSISSLLTTNDPLQIVNGRDEHNRESIAFTPDGESLYTVSEWTGDPEARHEVHVYDRVTDPSTTSDTLYGGHLENLSAGDDWYVGIAAEVGDWNVDDDDLILGLLADMNFDGVANGLDVDPFIMGINNPSGYLSDWGLGGYVHGDMNGDGVLNALDVSLFIAAVLGGGSESSMGFGGLGLDIDDDADADEIALALKHYIEVCLASA